MKNNKTEDAVSPVIGVMLMLVITVVIAGVVSVFGVGMAGDTEPAPTVILDVQILSNFGALDNGAGALRGPDFQIRHVSGDALDTGDIEIQAAWYDENGKFHDSKYSAEAVKRKYPNGLPAIGSSSPRMQPMYVKTQVPSIDGDYTYKSGGLDYYFGDYILTPGYRITSTTDFLYDGNNKGSQFMDVIFNDGEIITGNSLEDEGIMEYLTKGTPVQITILHIPSNSIIFDKEVIVQ